MITGLNELGIAFLIGFLIGSIVMGLYLNHFIKQMKKK